MEKQSEIKNHHSKWKDQRFQAHLSKIEKSISKILIAQESVIEEQKILLTPENLLYNSIF